MSCYNDSAACQGGRSVKQTAKQSCGWLSLRDSADSGAMRVPLMSRLIREGREPTRTGRQAAVKARQPLRSRRRSALALRKSKQQASVREASSRQRLVSAGWFRPISRAARSVMLSQPPRERDSSCFRLDRDAAAVSVSLVHQARLSSSRDVSLPRASAVASVIPGHPESERERRRGRDASFVAPWSVTRGHSWRLRAVKFGCVDARASTASSPTHRLSSRRRR